MSREFYLQDGKAITTIGELNEELLTMPDDIFNRYVNDEKNDFSNWIRDIHGDLELSKRIASVKDKRSMINLLEERKELIDVMRIIDDLLGKLSKEDIDKFSASPDFDLYKKIIGRYIT